jgi:hypothetical protein
MGALLTEMEGMVGVVTTAGGTGPVEAVIAIAGNVWKGLDQI